MASNVTRDHHNLRRNLKLNDNYISNDGGDEGIRITDAGLVGIGVTDPSNPLEIFSTQSQLKISYDASNYAVISVSSDGHLVLTNAGTDADITIGSAADFLIDATGDLTLDVTGDDINLVGSAGTGLKFSQANAGDWNMTNLTSDKDIIFNVIDGINLTEVMRLNGDVSTLDMATSKKLTFGAAEEYIYGDGTDIHIGVGANGDINIPADIGLTFGDDGEKIEGTGTKLIIASSGNLDIDVDGVVEFDGCGVGFDLGTPTYNASDTDVDFQTGNKQFVTFDGGNIVDLNLIFPKVSGNFLLMLKQDGTGGRTVTNYKVWDRLDDNAAGGSAVVKFAGGSNPDLTDDANHVDIISFFYDGDNEIAYGVATLDFQF